MTNTYKRPIGYNFDGEPKMIMTPDGVDWEIRGGQPVMDAGLENWAMIGLFTVPGWWGNYILDSEYQIGDCDFDTITREPLTMTSMMNADKEARRGLESLVQKKVASEIIADISARSGFGIDFRAEVRGPASTLANLMLQKYGLNWVRQTTDPANERLSDAYK
jgi:phage gp46-like protein